MITCYNQDVLTNCYYLNDIIIFDSLCSTDATCLVNTQFSLKVICFLKMKLNKDNRAKKFKIYANFNNSNIF